MKCEVCGTPINKKCFPGDRGCQACGHDPDEEAVVRKREEAFDARMRDQRWREHNVPLQM
jgi:hypothetical protein